MFATLFDPGGSDAVQVLCLPGRRKNIVSLGRAYGSSHPLWGYLCARRDVCANGREKCRDRRKFPMLPPEMVRHILTFGFHAGFY